MPRKIIKVEGKKALLQDGRWVRLDLVGEVRAGNYVIASADLAVEKISKTSALQMKEIIEQ